MALGLRPIRWNFIKQSSTVSPYRKFRNIETDDVVFAKKFQGLSPPLEYRIEDLPWSEIILSVMDKLVILQVS